MEQSNIAQKAAVIQGARFMVEASITQLTDEFSSPRKPTLLLRRRASSIVADALIQMTLATSSGMLVNNTLLTRAKLNRSRDCRIFAFLQCIH
jgi:hypothetical protein